MAKGTIILLSFLSLLSALLFGINIGKKIESREVAQLIPPNPQLTTYDLPPTTTPLSKPTTAQEFNVNSSKSDISTSQVGGVSSYSDGNCGFSFSYEGPYLNTKTGNGQSIIFTEKDNPKNFIAATCAKNMPKPSVSSDKIETITLDGISATIFHDQNPDGSPRDDVIVKHPTKGLDIIIVGYGETFQQILSSFKFLR